LLGREAPILIDLDLSRTNPTAIGLAIIYECLRRLPLMDFYHLDPVWDELPRGVGAWKSFEGLL